MIDLNTSEQTRSCFVVLATTAAALLLSDEVYAQSFRRGGAEFNAVRSVTVPQGKTYSAVVVEFLGHGEIRPDGRNVLVAAGNKDVVPHRILQVGPGDFCRVAFQPVEGQSAYDIFYGGEPPRVDPPSWTCRDGLLLETRKFRPCDLKSLDSVRKAFETADPIGADFVDGVFHAADPFNLRREPFLSRYSGYLHLREAGMYGFFTASRDCSFLLIDDKLVASAPGRHGPQRSAAPGTRHDVKLAAGAHKFEYYHAASGADAMMAVAWEINPPEKPQRPEKIPADAFRANLIGRLPAGRVGLRAGGQSPDFVAEPAGDVPLPDNDVPLLGVKFRDLSPRTLTAPGSKIRWDFGDGQTADLPNVDHVYLRPGLYEVTLSIRRGVKTAKMTNRIYVDRPQSMPGDKKRSLDEYLPIVETYDPSKLDAASLLQLVLVFEAKALAVPDQAETYLTKAVRAVQSGLRDGSVATGDDLLKLARQIGPMARFRLGDSPAAYDIWSRAADRIDAAESKAACEIAAADIAVNDLLRPTDAKPLLEAATKLLSPLPLGEGAGVRAANSPLPLGEGAAKKSPLPLGEGLGVRAELHRVWGDYHAAAGDGPAARKAYAEAERLSSSSRPLNVDTAKRGAHARSTEDFLASKQFVRAAEEIDAWLREYPAARLDGYLTLLTARYWSGREKYAQVIAQSEQLRAVNPDSPYVDQLLLLAADCEMRLGRKDRALATLHSLLNDYPGSPLVPLAKKNIELLEGGK